MAAALRGTCLGRPGWQRRLLLAFSCALGSCPASAEDTPTLTAGLPTAGRVATAEVRRYLVPLRIGDYTRIQVAQEGIDVGVIVRAPGGGVAAEALHRSAETRLVSLIAKETGLYELSIRALETDLREGGYTVELEKRSPARPDDRPNVEATRLFNVAERLWVDGTSAEDAGRVPGLYKAALEEWIAAGDVAGQALAARRLGRVEHAMGSLETAINQLQRSLTITRQTGGVREECAALVGLALVEIETGSMPDAGTHAQSALEAARRGGHRACEADALNALGDLFSYTSRTLEAPDSYTQALAISRELRDRRGEALALLNLGYANADLSRMADARLAYESALALWRAVADRRGEARTLIGLGQFHGILGERQAALVAYRQARGLVESLADRHGEAVVRSGMGAAYFHLGEPLTAIDHYRAAVSLFRAIRAPGGEGANLVFLGACLAAVRQYDEALAAEREALAKAASLSDQRLEAWALRNIGQILIETGRLDEALVSLERAASLSRDGGDLRAQGDAQDAVGNALQRQNRAADARPRFEEALRLARLGRDRFAESRALFGLARVDAAGGRLANGLSNLRASLSLVDDLRGDVASLDLRASYLASIRERQELEVDLLTQLDAGDAAGGYDRLAFEAAEQARARSLLDSLAEARAEIKEGVDPALVAREAALRQELNAKARRQGDKAAVLEKEIDELRLALRELRDRIRAESPRYAALTEPRPLSLADVQKTVVDDESVLLQYFVGARQSRVWAVTKGAITGRVLPGREAIESLVLPYRQALAGPEAGGPSRQAAADGPDARTAVAVSRALLGPVADQLGAARIVVVADGILEALPFAALPDPRRSREDGEVVPLVREHEVVHLPSASTLALIRGAEPAAKTWGKEVLVFADPVFEADDPRVPRRARQARASQPAASAQASARSLRSIDGAASLSRLIGSGQEARRIASLTTGADVLVGFQANVASALDPAVRDHRIVHFATHAIVDNERPELSGIALSLFDERGAAREGFVRLYDIYNMKLPVDLVVLSGCSSAMGKRVAGEGLISLVRGFMYAGARLVLASLWKVDDEATSELMARFYQAMWKEGLQPAAALRAAQLELMSQKRWRHPFYWAGFVLSGDWDLRYSRGAQPANHGTDSSFRAARSAPPAAGTGPRAGGSTVRAASAQPDNGVRIPGLRQPRRAGGRDPRPGRTAAARDGKRLRGERRDAIRLRSGLERGSRVVQTPHRPPAAGVVGGAGAATGTIRGERAARPLPRALPRNARGIRAPVGASVLRGREDREDPTTLGPRGRAGAEPECPAAPDPQDHEPAARVRLRVRGPRAAEGGRAALELGRLRGVKEP